MFSFAHGDKQINYNKESKNIIKDIISSSKKYPSKLEKNKIKKDMQEEKLIREYLEAEALDDVDDAIEDKND